MKSSLTQNSLSLKENLNRGNFSIFFAINTPDNDSDLSIVLARLHEFRMTCANITEFPFGLAIIDNKSCEKNYNTAEFASMLCAGEEDRHLVFLSGKDSGDHSIDNAIRCYHERGLINIVAVTGNGVKELKPVRHCDSVDILQRISKAELNRILYPGCVVNPFKYIPSESFPQYLKLIKKFKAGANFVVTQTGWDMLKLQELRWYLESRGFFYPSIARLTFLKQESIEKIIRGQLPGIQISGDFLEVLKNESRFGEVQFSAAQWRRIQFHVTGAKLMGYSGVIINGIDTPEMLEIFRTKVMSAFNEFIKFEDWKDGYFSFTSRAEMFPYPRRFYIFNNLFSSAYPNLPVMRFGRTPDCTIREKMIFNILKFFKRANKSNLNSWMKKVFARCVTCGNCMLPESHFVCRSECPKRLVEGPCGGSDGNGQCESGNFECMHSKIFRLASWKMMLILWSFPALSVEYIF